MISLVEQIKSQRKTFTLPSYIVKNLEEYANDFDKKQSQVIALALEEFFAKEDKSNKVSKRMEALDALVGIAPKGSLKGLDMKCIRANRSF
jgi:macrodomain Ter protein organizer (MatP/YcbG family)